MSSEPTALECRDGPALLASASNTRQFREQVKYSALKFVRSQTRVALHTQGATGRRMSALETLDAFGPELLRRIYEDGSAPLIKGPDEPAATLRARRQALDLAIGDVAARAGLASELVERAETPGVRSSVRDLEKLAQVLALDEYRLGTPGAGGDDVLAAELKGRDGPRDGSRLSPEDRLTVAGAAWVISRERELSRRIDADRGRNDSPPDLARFALRHRDVAGAELAASVRQACALRPDDPIASLEPIIWDRLGVPVISARLDEKIAVVAVWNGDECGLVVNAHGANRNVWVRRVAIAHGLGHLLAADRPHVVTDDYSEIEAGYTASSNADPSESRAGTFALEFLAPPAGVKQVAEATSPTTALKSVMLHYGVPAGAAKHHIMRATSRDVPDYTISDVPWWEISGRDLSRQGRFALLATIALDRRLISRDSAMAALNCSEDELSRHAEMLERGIL